MSDGNIAIVGMGCLFPRAPDLGSYWRNILEGVDAITDVPAIRWDPIYYDPQSHGGDRLYCRRGGFIDDLAAIDTLAFGIMPVEAQTAEPDQLLALGVATSALSDAGYDARPFPRERTGVILGRGNYMSVGLTRLNERLRTAEQLAASIRALAPDMEPEVLERMKCGFQSQFGACEGGSAIGLVPNLAASRIANRLDLNGPAYTIDAACASALVAVDQACDQLRRGSGDMMLAGGIHLSQDVTFWSVFCRLGALSRREQIRPFDRQADGLLIGEGIGIVVLKRLADAERDGDRIYAVIRGIGVASDGREVSLMNPRSEGQILALERAWAQAGLPPSSIGLIEAHGTGTPAGDAAELATLARFFGPAAAAEEKAGVGSVKSMIGHTMPAAGAAGLIKAALAVYHGVLPPTLHCEDPNPALAATRFRPIQEVETWDSGTHRRRAGVNAFGFGGINVHVVLESCDRGSARAFNPTPPEHEAIWTYAAGDAATLLNALRESDPRGGAGTCRLALFNPTRERRERAGTIVRAGAPWRGHDDIWFVPDGLFTAGGKVALLFPGLDAAFRPRVEDVASQFGLAPPARAATEHAGELGVAVVAVNRLLHRAISELGVRPAAVAGHSIGEWNAMIAGGMIPEAAVDDFVHSFQALNVNLPNVVYAAAGCSAHEAARVIQGLADIFISHDNCPHQVILCGVEPSVEGALARLRAAGTLGQKLRFRSGFHSPLLAPYLTPFQADQECFPIQAATVPVWSATTCAPYPSDPAAIRSLAIDHLLHPVHFRELIEALYDCGIRIFLQAGSGSVPTFVDDTLRNRPHLAIAANLAQRSGLAQLRRVAAALFVEGLEVSWSWLGLEPEASRPPKSAAPPLKLALGVPLSKLEVPTRPRSGDPMPTTLEPSLHGLAAAPRSVSERRILSVETIPQLIDHCLVPQSPRCRSLQERYPVVPMTTSIALLIESARKLAPEQKAVSIEHVRSYRWLAVAPPVEVEICARLEGLDQVHTEIQDYVEGTVRLAGGYAQPPAAVFEPLAGERPAFITAAQLYRGGRMFHGPSFQGVVELGPIGQDGITGVIEVGEAPGALLDNAGQLFGYWVMACVEEDSLAMPIGVDRIEFYGDEPRAGTRVLCRVRIRELNPISVRADMELMASGRLWARVTGWEDRRLQTDDRLWPVLRHPGRHLLAQVEPEGYAYFHDTYKQAASRDFLARRFLSEAEREVYLAVAPQHQRRWLAGRVAAKDAARAWLWNHGAGPVYPAEVQILSDASGPGFARGSFDADLRVAIAHQDDIAVAMVGEGSPPAIAIERISASKKSPSPEVSLTSNGARAGNPGDGDYVVIAG